MWLSISVDSECWALQPPLIEAPESVGLICGRRSLRHVSMTATVCFHFLAAPGKAYLVIITVLFAVGLVTKTWLLFITGSHSSLAGHAAPYCETGLMQLDHMLGDR